MYYSATLKRNIVTSFILMSSVLPYYCAEASSELEAKSEQVVEALVPASQETKAQETKAQETKAQETKAQETKAQETSKIEVPPQETSMNGINQQESSSLMREGFKTIIMLMVLLVGFWWFSSWLKKSGKLSRIAGSHTGIECLSVYSVGQKEKIALIRVKDQELLVGITQHAIQTLHHFKQESDEDKDAPGDAEFSKLMDTATTNTQT